MARAQVALLVSVLIGGCAGGAAAPAARPAPPASAASVPAWLLPADACPADVIAAVSFPMGEFFRICEADPDACLRRCEAREPTACYAAGLHVYMTGGPAALSEALYLRACQLGNVSGCTNRAAGMLKESPGDATVEACAARTFAITCERRDAWGCTMFGASLAQGRGVAEDPDRALEVLPRACLHDEADPACTAAREWIQAIETRRGAP